MDICYIFCALDSGIQALETSPGDYIIAADAGYKQTQKLGLKPDLVVGDFDSLKSVPENEMTVIHPVRKDDTDFLLAVKEGLKRGYKKFIVFGAVGARLDHTLGAIQVTTFAAENGAVMILSSDSFCITSVKNSKISFKSKSEGILSVFAVTCEAYGVTIKGLSYETDDITLKPDFPIGVSNEFTGKPAIIKVTDGILTVMWQGSPDDIIFREE